MWNIAQPLVPGRWRVGSGSILQPSSMRTVMPLEAVPHESECLDPGAGDQSDDVGGIGADVPTSAYGDADCSEPGMAASRPRLARLAVKGTLAFAMAAVVAAVVMPGNNDFRNALSGQTEVDGSRETADTAGYVSEFSEDIFADSKEHPLHIRAWPQDGHGVPHSVLKDDHRMYCLQRDPIEPKVQMEPCSAIYPFQQWRYVQSTGHVIAVQGGLCLARSYGISNVSLRECLHEDPLLKWHYTNGHLSNLHGHCLSWHGQVHMQKCGHNPELTHIRFFRFPESLMKYTKLRWPSGPKHIRQSIHGGSCIQYNGWQIWRVPCRRDEPKQQFVFFRETRQIMSFWHKKCLEAGWKKDAPPHTGVVWMAPCNEHSPGQRWYVNMRKHHISSLGLCLNTWDGASMSKCSPSWKNTWRMRREPGWALHAGVLHPPFKAPKKIPPNIPKEQDECKIGTKKYGRCGAEDLRQLPIPKKKLQELQYLIWKKSFPYKVVVHVGDERGLFFRYGKKYQDKNIRLASEFKPMTAVVAMRLVELGVLNLDDRVNKWLSWWPRETADSRSYITLRHCLSFTSGFYGQHMSQLDGSPNEWYPFNPNAEPFEWYELECKEEDAILCAKNVLFKVPHISPPGVLWTYTEDHLRIAVAMMVAATGKSLGDLMEEHLFRRTVPPMKRTRKYSRRVDHWNPGSNVISSARDYQRFLDSYFRGRLVANHTQHEMEADSQVYTKARYFMGVPGEGRPKDHGLFGLGFWRSHSVKTQCGVYGWCAYAPSYFMSTGVVERDWARFTGAKKCPWAHSDSCSFYYHWQNIDHMSLHTAQYRFHSFSREIGMKVHELLSDGHEIPGSHA